MTLNQELMKSVAGIYMKLLYDYDVSNQMPVNINEELIKFYKSIDNKLLENEGLNLNVLQSKKELLEESIRDIALKEDSIIAKINNKLIRTVRALDFEDNIIYRLDEVQKPEDFIQDSRLH